MTADSTRTGPTRLAEHSQWPPFTYFTYGYLNRIIRNYSFIQLITRLVSNPQNTRKYGQCFVGIRQCKVRLRP